MTTLNAAFETKLTLEDGGYESGSENFNIPTCKGTLWQAGLWDCMSVCSLLWTTQVLPQ